MNWISIKIHALLLLGAGVVVGILEPQPSLNDQKAYLFSLLLLKGALLLVYFGIFAHMALRVSGRPLAHAMFALLISEAIAFAILSLLPVEPTFPWGELAIEYTILLVALALGTSLGSHFRRRTLLLQKRVGPS